MKMREEKLSIDRLRYLIDYDCATGIFLWKKSPCNSVKVGAIAGNEHGTGYLQINIDGTKYYAHRLAWFYVHNEWPESDVDHVNGVRHDNRIANLRSVTKAANVQNMRSATSRNKSGFLGVSHISASQKYRAQIYVDGRHFYLGEYESPEVAHAVYRKVKRQLHVGCTI